MRGILLYCSIFLCAIAHSALCESIKVDIDGVVSATEWTGAQVVDTFTLTYPYKLTKPKLHTVAKVLSLPDGLAIAFICDQPKDVARNNASRPRDATPNSDTVSAVIDFDGSSSRAYEFTVGAGGGQVDSILSGENSFNKDWDGVWQSAVAQNDAGWSAELLIPWSTVPMAKSKSENRTIRLSFDRAVWALGEYYSYPAISAAQSRYLSDFTELAIASYEQSSLSVVPYLSTRYDLIGKNIESRAGADVSWRPSSNFGLTATVQPDFGQVESDQLVVNFDAIEVAFSDKRPFFTENQSFFDVRDRNQNQLIYTRRVGAQNELDGAVKLTASTNGFEYGAFAATEADASGRDFFALRALVPGETVSVGYLLTKFDSPVDADALVQGVDLKLRAGERQTFDSLFIISKRGLGDQSSKDFGGTASWSYTSPAWDLKGGVTHYGKNLNFNDFGYLARANLNNISTAASWRPQQARADGGAVSYSLVVDFNFNDQGLRLSDQVFAYRQFDPVGGGFHQSQFLWSRAGNDDLISRGNGPFKRNARVQWREVYRSPQLGKWRHGISLQNLEEGLGGRAWNVNVSESYQATNALSFDLSASFRRSSDWLVWRGQDLIAGNESLFARYRRTLFSTNLNVNWIPTPKHELRLKLQSLIINAADARAVRLGPNGSPYQTDEVIAPLQVRNFGVQLRYRYEIAPLRELYVVYARGGIDQDREQLRDSIELFQDSFDLRSSDQFLLKMRWGL